MDNIDVDYAIDKGIYIINTPKASCKSVAELVFAHFFSLARFLHESNRLMPLEGETKFKTQTASLFYRMIDRITDIKIPLDTGDFRLMDRKVVNIMVAMREHNRFLRGMSAWTGFRQVGVEYKRKARHAGVTKYPLKKMLRLAMNAVTGFSMWPLQLATRLGLILSALGVLAIPVVIVLRYAADVQFHGLATLAILMTLLSALILVFLGFIGEYLGRVYDEAKNRPLYIVAEGPREPFNPVRLDLPAETKSNHS